MPHSDLTLLATSGTEQTGEHHYGSGRRFWIERGSVQVVESETIDRVEPTEAPLTITFDYERYGTDEANPTILLCPALTGTASAVSHGPNGGGWWDRQIGPGSVLDTDRYTIIVLHPRLRQIAHDIRSGLLDRDRLSVRRLAELELAALRRRGIDHLHAVVGGSFGGMIGLELGIIAPDFINTAVLMATSWQTSAWRRGLNHVVRQILAAERYGTEEEERQRLSLARSLALLNYRGMEELERRFGRNLLLHDNSVSSPLPERPPTRDVVSYLNYHGERITERLTLAEYDLFTSLLDSHDVGRGREEERQACRSLRRPALCIGFASDHLYPSSEVERLAHLLPYGEFREVDAVCGHDSFLVETTQLRDMIAPFLARYDYRFHTGRTGSHEGARQPEGRLSQLLEGLEAEI